MSVNNTISNKGFLTTKSGSLNASSSLTIESNSVIINGTVTFNGPLTGSYMPTGSVGPQGPSGSTGPAGPTGSAGPTNGYGRLETNANTVAMYYFDGNLNDSSGNGHHLSVQSGDPMYITGPKLRKFIANNQPASFVTTDAALRLTGNMSFEFVGKFYPSSLAVLAVSGDAGSWNWAVEVFPDSSNQIICYYHDDNFATNEFRSVYNLPMNEVAYVVLTRDVTNGHTTNNLYINGLMAAPTQVVSNSVPRIADTNFHALSWHDGGFNFYENNQQNQARQMHICSRVLTLTEIQSRSIAVLPPGY